MLRRLFFALALAFMFGFGQQSAAVHEISHYADVSPSSQQQDKAPHSPLCEKCLSYSGMASALGVSHYAPPTVAAGFEPYTYHSSNHHSPNTTAYSARAPPVLA